VNSLASPKINDDSCDRKQANSGDYLFSVHCFLMIKTNNIP
jgi:hypothetical protein